MDTIGLDHSSVANQSDAAKTLHKYEEEQKERARLRSMTIGQRIDHNINKLQGEVERLMVVRRRLGAAADIKCDELSSAVYHLIANDNPF